MAIHINSHSIGKILFRNKTILQKRLEHFRNKMTLFRGTTIAATKMPAVFFGMGALIRICCSG